MDIASLRIGASEVAPALGLSPYQTRLEWYARKVGLLDRDEGNEATTLGQYLEDGLGRLFADSHRVRLERGANVRHPTVPWMAATPDFLVPWDAMTASFKQLVDAKPGEVILVEIKTTGLATWRPADVINREWGEPGSHDVPVSYAAQVQQQIACVDAAWRDAGIGFCRRAFVKALLPGRGAPEFVIDSDPTIVSFIKSQLEEMVHCHLVPELPPEPVTMTDWQLQETLVARPWKEKKRRTATESEEEMVQGWRAAKAARDASGLEAARLRTSLVQSIGDAYGLDLSFGRILYTGGKESSRIRKATAFDAVLDWAATAAPDVAAAIGDIATRHTRASSSGRRLMPHFTDEPDEGTDQ